MVNAILIFVGLSLDSFIVMMKKGASLRRQTMKDTLLCSLVYALINAAMFMIGYLVSIPFAGVLPDGRPEILAAAVLINFIGVYLATKSFLVGRFEERLDKEFNLKKLIRLAVVTSIDTMVVGIGFSLFGIHTLDALGMAILFSFIAVFAGLKIGAELGVGYQRTIGLLGGLLMIVFSLLVFVKYGLR